MPDWTFDQATLKEMYHDGIGLLPHLAIGALTFLIFWLVAKIVRRAIIRIGSRRRVNEDAVYVIAQTVYVSMICFGVVTTLAQMKYNVTGLIAGLGLTGFALGIAFKDIISNLLSGILILVYKPFQRHDRIAVTGLEGTVAQIDLRYTTLVAADRKFLIPNANLFSNPITVFYNTSPAPVEPAPSAAPAASPPPPAD